MTRVAVLKGGRSLERQVSLKSGARVEAALGRLGHVTTPIDVGHDLIDQLLAARPEVAFVALHGRDGEDGTVQELLEILDIPYTASGVSACIRCADKVLAKHVLLDGGLPTPDFYAFNETAFKELGAAAALAVIERRLGFPLVVKPASQGSALGVKLVADQAHVPAALVAAFSYDRKVLLERYVDGREFAVSVLQTADGSRAEALPVLEAMTAPDDNDFFAARYEIGRTTFSCPADLPEAVAAQAQELALAVYRLMGCYGLARVDMMRDATSGSFAVLEVNVIPGLTETSLLPQAADAAGISFDALITRILDSAVARP